MIRKRLVVLALPLALLAFGGLISTADANHSVQALVSIGPNGGNGAFDATFAGSTPPGERAYIETDEALVAGDTDGRNDVYERKDLVTTLISTGSGGNGTAHDAYFLGVSEDGSKVIFETTQQLAAGDTDQQVDLYQRSGGATTLLTTGPGGGNGAIDAFFAGISRDASKVFFETAESLVAGDTDLTTDLYERSGGTTTQLSTGTTGGNGAFPVSTVLTGPVSSDDGTHVFFETDESLVVGDGDPFTDVYERFGGTTTLVSTGTSSGSAPEADSKLVGFSADGTRVFFETTESRATGDTDTQNDIYQRFGGVTTQLSIGTINGNGSFPITYGGASRDGTHVYFETVEKLLASDTDNSRDVYDRSGSSTSHVSTGPTGGNGAFPAFFEAASQNGSRAFFRTQEVVAAGDSDSRLDVYERSGGTSTLITTGSTGGNGAFDVLFFLINLNGDRAFFETDESLTAGDTDGGVTDIYERFGGATTHISTGPTSTNSPDVAFLWTTSEDGLKVFYDTIEALTADDTDGQLDVYVAMVNALFPRPGGGTPLRVPLVPSYKVCTTPNTTHVAPLALPSCNPATLDSSILTTSNTGVQLGFVRYQAIVGDPGTTADETDVSIQVAASDVKRTSNGSDYTGQVIATTAIRLTDRANGFSGTESATATDSQLSAPITCIATGGTAGANCNLTTSADALLPGIAKEGKRTVISAFSVQVLDAGADNSVTPPSGTCPITCGSGDEKVYLTQGLFLP